MAFSVKKGDEISLAEMKSGEGAKGVWAMIPVKSEKSKDRITCWAENAEEARYFTGKARIKDITSVSISHTKSNDNTTWYTNYSFSAVLDGRNERKSTATKGLNTFDDFLSVPDGDDGLPFK